MTYEYGLFNSRGELIGSPYSSEHQARCHAEDATAWKITLELRRREIGPWLPVQGEPPPKCVCFRQWLSRPDDPVVVHDAECPLAVQGEPQ